MDREQIRREVRAVVLQRLGGATPPAVVAAPASAPAPSWRRFDDARDHRARALVTVDDVMRARAAQKPLVVPSDAILTPLARETCERFRIPITTEAAPTKPAPLARVESPAPAPLPSTAPDSAPGSTPVVRTVALAADHGGFPLKQALKTWLERDLGYAVADLGTNSAEAVDYPDFAHRAAAMVQRGEADRAIIVDAAGLGSAMAANRHPGVRAAPCSTILEAVSTREHNDANVLCLGGRHLGEDAAKAIARVFLTTAFAGGRHLRRVQKIEGA